MMKYRVFYLLLLCLSMEAMEYAPLQQDQNSWSKDKPSFTHVTPEWYDKAVETLHQLGVHDTAVSSILQISRCHPNPSKYVFCQLLLFADARGWHLPFSTTMQIIDLSFGTIDTAENFFPSDRVREEWFCKALIQFFGFFDLDQTCRNLINFWFPRFCNLLRDYKEHYPDKSEQLCLEYADRLLQKNSEERVRCLRFLYTLYPEQISEKVNQIITGLGTIVGYDACVGQYELGKLLHESPEKATQLARAIVFDETQPLPSKRTFLTVVLNHFSDWHTICTDYFLLCCEQNRPMEAIGTMLRNAQTNEHKMLGFEFLALYAAISKDDWGKIGICLQQQDSTNEKVIRSILSYARSSSIIKYDIMRYFDMHCQEIYGQVLLDETINPVDRMDALKNMIMNCSDASLSCLQQLPSDSTFRSKAIHFVENKKNILNS